MAKGCGGEVNFRWCRDRGVELVLVKKWGGSGELNVVKGLGGR